MKLLLQAALAAVVLSGCASSNDIAFEVIDPAEHLMHSIDENGNHPHWYDGCRARDLETDQLILIWWNNNAISDTEFSFQKGATYKASFTGDFGDDFVEGEGTSLNIFQLISLEKQP